MLSDLLGAQSGRKSKLVEDRYIVLCTVTINQKTKQNTKKKKKHQKQPQTQTEHKHTKLKTNKPKENRHHRAVRMNSPEGGKGLPGGATPARSFNMFGACCKLELIN